jgi:hypothetical protein
MQVWALGLGNAMPLLKFNSSLAAVFSAAAAIASLAFF